MVGIRLFVGLGNPTEKYNETRHNAGFWLLDKLAENYGVTFKVKDRFYGEYGSARIDGGDVVFLKPLTYMNNSGRSVLALMQYFKVKPSGLLVAHDELDFPSGLVRLKKGGGHGGHNGLRDIIVHLGSNDFYRIRIGIGRPPVHGEVVPYVLSKPSHYDRAKIDEALDLVQENILGVVHGDYQGVMNALHATDPL